MAKIEYTNGIHALYLKTEVLNLLCRWIYDGDMDTSDLDHPNMAEIVDVLEWDGIWGDDQVYDEEGHVTGEYYTAINEAVKEIRNVY